MAFLLLAQTLGLVHRSVHSGVGPGGAPGAGFVQKAQSGGDHERVASNGLFSDHAQGKDCRLLDGLLQGGPSAVFELASLPAPACLAFSPAPYLHTQARLSAFDARGPPRRT